MVIKPCQLKNKNPIRNLKSRSTSRERKVWEREKVRSCLLALWEDDPGRVKLGREDLSRIFQSHSSQSSNGSGEGGPLLRPDVLRSHEQHDQPNSHCYSYHQPQKKRHFCEANGDITESEEMREIKSLDGGKEV